MNPEEYGEEYYNNRKEFRYYKYIRNMLTILSYRAESICDVGSNGVDLISFLPCKYKTSIDPNNPLELPGIQSIKDDFLSVELPGKYDIITCFQVLEHINNDNIDKFVHKLKKAGEVVVISVPYKWPHGLAEYHIQDPVDEEKLYSWFLCKPIFADIIVDDFPRLIAVYIDDDTEKKLEKINEIDCYGIKQYLSEFTSKCSL